MSAGAVIAEALKAMAGTVGSMALALELRRSVPRSVILTWVARLRAAADKLEELT